MSFLFWLGIFIISFIVLIKAADYFTDAAEKLGFVLGMPQFVVGVVIIAIGSSLPELATSLMSVYAGEAQMLAGNVLGTVIVNILLGMGLAVLICRKTLDTKHDVFLGDFPVFLGAIILVIFTLRDGTLTAGEAVLYLLGYLIYLFHSRGVYRIYKKDLEHLEEKKPKFEYKILVVLGLSLLAIFLSSHYLINSVIWISGIVGLSTSILATTAVAIGTSLPEISIAISAAKKGKVDMLVGDIIGSNIFDIFVIFGVGGLIQNIPVPAEVITFTLPFIVATTFLYWIIFQDKKITATEGVLMVLMYVLFFVKLIGVV